MRRLLIVSTILLALFALTLCSSRYLDGYTGRLIALLRQAEASTADGDWDAAADKTEAALELWRQRETYLHMVLQHRDTDEVLLGFQEVLQLINHREDGGEYAAANAKLITRIALLGEMEQLNWKNVM